MAGTEEQNRRVIVRRSVDKWRHSEAGLLSEMSDLLPYSPEVKATLNKPSILRLASVYIQLKKLEKEVACPEVWDGTETLVDSYGGFLLTVHDTGLILHISSQVYNILGYHAHDLIGQNFMDYLHPEDRQVFLRKTAPFIACGQAGHSMKVDFMARLKYKTMAREKKTKNTGYLGMQVRGHLKRAGSGPDSCWLLIGACYPLFVVLSMEIKNYEASFIIRFDKNRQPVDVPDKFGEFLGFDYKMMRMQKKSVIAKDHAQYLVDIDRLIATRGAMDCMTRTVTRTGYLLHLHSREMTLYGSNGERDLTIILVFIVRIRFAEYLGIEPKLMQKKRKFRIAKDHIPYLVNGWKLLDDRGSVDWLFKFVTKTGHLVHIKHRLMGVYDPKGDIRFIQSVFLALRKESFKAELGWPGNSLIRMCPDFFGVPGEEGMKTGVSLEAVLGSVDDLITPDDINSLSLSPETNSTESLQITSSDKGTLFRGKSARRIKHREHNKIIEASNDKKSNYKTQDSLTVGVQDPLSDTLLASETNLLHSIDECSQCLFDEENLSSSNHRLTHTHSNPEDCKVQLQSCRELVGGPKTLWSPDSGVQEDPSDIFSLTSDSSSSCSYSPASNNKGKSLSLENISQFDLSHLDTLKNPLVPNEHLLPADEHNDPIEENRCNPVHTVFTGEQLDKTQESPSVQFTSDDNWLPDNPRKTYNRQESFSEMLFSDECHVLGLKSSLNLSHQDPENCFDPLPPDHLLPASHQNNNCSSWKEPTIVLENVPSDNNLTTVNNLDDYLMETVDAENLFPRQSDFNILELNTMCLKQMGSMFVETNLDVCQDGNDLLTVGVLNIDNELGSISCEASPSDSAELMEVDCSEKIEQEPLPQNLMDFVTSPTNGCQSFTDLFAQIYASQNIPLTPHEITLKELLQENNPAE